MKISTKTLVVLLIVTVMTLSSSSLVAATGGGDKAKAGPNRLERIIRRHDRKLELQASILGITPQQLKEELKTSDFDAVLKKHGFKTREDFSLAMTGKLKDELKKRGWSDEKIQKFVDKRLKRLQNKT